MFQTILYATDFSELSLYALRYAAGLARLCGSRFHCIHVVDNSFQYWVAPEAGGLSPMVPAGPPLEELMKAAQKQLDEFAAKHLPTELGAHTKLLFGRPFVEIIRYAKQVQADLIVIGTHGRSALKQVLIGGVAAKVVRKAPCPVLTVRHPEHTFEMP